MLISKENASKARKTSSRQLDKEETSMTSESPSKKHLDSMAVALIIAIVVFIVILAGGIVLVLTTQTTESVSTHYEPAVVFTDEQIHDVMANEDELSDTGSTVELLGPVFSGDYQAYIANIRAERERAIQEEQARIAQEEAERIAAEQAANAGAQNDDAIDTSNVSAMPEVIELPPIVIEPVQTQPTTQPSNSNANSNTNGNVGNTGTSVPAVAGLPSNYKTLTQSAFAGKSLNEKINLIGAMAQQDMHESGILASITAAQCILESGWMESGLAKRNGMFGIKTCALENNWAESPWDGSAVSFETNEEYSPGTYTTIVAAFRTYPNVWNSIKDHSAYLKHAKKGNSPRYPGIVGEKNPRTAITIIKNGGYATSSTYIDSIMQIVNQYQLTRFDV